MCVLRVEKRGEGAVLITVTTSTDVNTPLSRRTRAVAEPAEALAAVAEFLRECREIT
jgi:hypothetical protein